MTSPVRTYLSEIHKVHALGAGTDEISLYNPLQNLLNKIGRKLKSYCQKLVTQVSGGAFG